MYNNDRRQRQIEAFKIKNGKFKPENVLGTRKYCKDKMGRMLGVVSIR